jgi:hypothetical protein
MFVDITIGNSRCSFSNDSDGWVPPTAVVGVHAFFEDDITWRHAVVLTVGTEPHVKNGDGAAHTSATLRPAEARLPALALNEIAAECDRLQAQQPEGGAA